MASNGAPSGHVVKKRRAFRTSFACAGCLSSLSAFCAKDEKRRRARTNKIAHGETIVQDCYGTSREVADAYCEGSVLLLVLAPPCAAVDVDDEGLGWGVGGVVDIKVLVAVAELGVSVTVLRSVDGP